MVQWASGTANGYTLIIDASEGTVDYANNRSYLAYRMTLRSSDAYFTDTTVNANLAVAGVQVYSVSQQMSTSPFTDLILVDSFMWVQHDGGGNRQVEVSGNIATAEQGNPWDVPFLSTGGIITLTHIPQLPYPPSSCTVARNGRTLTVTSGPSSTPGADPITGYQCQATTPDQTAWDNNTTANMNANRQFSYTNLPVGHSYRFRSRALSSAGAGPWVESSPIFLPAGGKRNTGSAFVNTTIAKRNTGSAWVDLTIAKRYTGSAWVDLS